MNIAIAFGEPVIESHWLYTEMRRKLPKCKYVLIGSKRKNVNYRKYGFTGWLYIQMLQFDTARRAVRATSANDIIITQDFGTGRYASFISIIFRKKRKILALNCLQRRQSGIKRSLEKVIDFFAWKNDSLITTVNSKKELQLISIPKFRIEKVHILEDVFVYYNKNKSKKRIKYDCFTGGYANRDFNQFFKIAEYFKTKSFVCVVGVSFKNEAYNVPTNVHILKDIDEKEFFNLMKESAIIVIPLLRDETSGLVVLKDAIKFEKIVLSSNTEAVSNYIPDQLKPILLANIGDSEDYINKMKYLFSLSSSKKEKIVQKLIDFNEQFSPQNQMIKILNILDKENFL